MNVLVVLCHPIPKSFNSQIASAVCASVTEGGHGLTYHDLYREEFDPLLKEDEYLRKFSLEGIVQRYMADIVEADLLVFVHPDWWGQMPALLKGWVDRVFRPGIAFEYSGEEFLPKQREGLLVGKRGIAYCTTDSERTEGPHPLINIWEKNIFEFCGIKGKCRLFHSTGQSDPIERREWLRLVSGDIERLLTNDA